MPPIDLPFSKVLLRLEGGAWTSLSRSNAERLRNENTQGLYEVQVRRFTPRSYKWEPLTSDYEHRARAAFRARKVGEEPKPAAVEEETRLLHGCAECGKTSTPDSMWALYCVQCVEDKIAPALVSPPEPLPEAPEAPGTVKVPGYGYVDLRAVRAIEAALKGNLR